jgi:prepilin-type N-terminal cleavage/methylation domain-containing protein
MNAVMKKSGFTLVEVMIAIIMVGLAIASLMGASLSFTRANALGTELSTAEFLIEQIREMSALLPVIDPDTGTSAFGHEEVSLAAWDDLDDFDGAVFSPPINAQRETLTDFAPFSQRVTVQNVSAGNFEQVVADHGSNFVRVTARVFFNSREISSVSWIRARY